MNTNNETETINDGQTIYLSSPTFPLLTVDSINNVSFYSGSNVIGKLSWEDGTMKFSGSAEESAKIFFDYIIKPNMNYEHNKS